MKTVALSLQMAKCGMYIRAGKDSEKSGPTLRWFDRILADVGDGQSMESNLSTFSSHITRISRIVTAVTAEDLVLLDEVGSGTNPAEGSSLACAILSHLAAPGRAGLTLATTHFTEIKRMAITEPGFMNACVSFDLKTLTPTYQLVWGQTGDSNARQIAAAIGLPVEVLADANAQHVAIAGCPDAASGGSGGGSDARDETNTSMVEDLSRQSEGMLGLRGRARAALRGITAVERRLGSETKQKGKVEAAGKGERKGEEKGEGKGVREGSLEAELVDEEAAFRTQAFCALDRAVAEFESGAWDQHRVESLFKRVEASARQRELRLSTCVRLSTAEDAEEVSLRTWRPRVGERVRMKKFGGTRALVTGYNERDHTVTLKKGNVVITSAVSEVLPLSSS